jgi:hypothetical protein
MDKAPARVGLIGKEQERQQQQMQQVSWLVNALLSI